MVLEIKCVFQGGWRFKAVDKLTLPRGLKPKVQLPGQVSTKLTLSPDWMLDWRGRWGKFPPSLGEKMLWELEVADWEVGWARVE